MRKLLLILGALAGVILVAAGVAMAIAGIDGISDVRIEDTRTPIPGERDARLDAGKYVIFYEVAGEGTDEKLDVPPLNVRVGPTQASRFFELDDYSADFNVSSGGRKAQAVATVDVPEEAPYTIAVSGSSNADEPAVVLGKPVTPRALRLVAGATGVLAGLGLVALVAALSIGLAARSRRAAA